MPGFPETGHCEIAETDYDDNPSRRLIMRLVHVLDEHQQPPFPTWDHHAFVTNRTAPIRDEDLHHRAHAVVELGLRDLKDNGLAHWPSGRFNANAAFPLGELSANTAKAGPAGRRLRSCSESTDCAATTFVIAIGV